MKKLLALILAGILILVGCSSGEILKEPPPVDRAPYEIIVPEEEISYYAEEWGTSFKALAIRNYWIYNPDKKGYVYHEGVLILPGGVSIKTREEEGKR